MSDISRRDVLRRLGLALMATGALDRVSAQEVHHLALAQTAGGTVPYSPKALSDHGYRTLERLTDLIVPVENGKPGAVAARAAAWIDMLASENPQLKDLYTGGISWIDGAMKKRGAADFVSAPPGEQTALLDRRIRHQRNAMLAHPRREVPLDAAAREGIEHLIGRHGRAAFERVPFVHFIEIQVAHAVLADFSVGPQAVEGLQRFGEWHAAAPVQQVEVEKIGLQAF